MKLTEAHTQDFPVLSLLDDLAKLAAELQIEGLLDTWRAGQDPAPGCPSSDFQQ